MRKQVCVIGGGLAGSEAALSLAKFGIGVTLFEMRPNVQTPVHHTSNLAELVCSNSLKSEKADSAAGMLKEEMRQLGSFVYAAALKNRVPAGGALAVDREKFSAEITALVEDNPLIEVKREEVTSISKLANEFDAVVLATGPLTSDALSEQLIEFTGSSQLAFYDAAAPIVMADSIDMSRAFRQSRYEEDAENGDYINCPFTREEYDAFIDELVAAKRVVGKDFESRDLFQACQPIEEIARKGHDAPRFGALKPVGLTDPSTGRRPWAALQLRAEDAHGCSFNLVGFQTNLTFPEQRRVFSMIPGLENAEFARYGVMHRNTYVDSPRVLNGRSQLITEQALTLGAPVYIAGQLSGTEGYCEAIRSGLHVAISVASRLLELEHVELSDDMAFGALLHYATNPETKDYQPMHVNFGILPPFEQRIRNKKERYAKYAERGNVALGEYVAKLHAAGLNVGATEV